MAFYFRIFRIKNAPEIVVLTFIYKPKKSFVGKVYDKFMRYIVTSGYIKYFVVFSESEKKRYADYFDVPETRFVFETLGYEDKTQKVPICNPDNFYLAAGRSNRDYKFLVDAWSKSKEQLKIVCDTSIWHIFQFSVFLRLEILLRYSFLEESMLKLELF